jgi:hypothetical protein
MSVSGREVTSGVHDMLEDVLGDLYRIELDARVRRKVQEREREEWNQKRKWRMEAGGGSVGEKSESEKSELQRAGQERSELLRTETEKVRKEIEVERDKYKFGIGGMVVGIKLHKTRGDSWVLVGEGGVGTSAKDGEVGTRPIVSRSADYSTIGASLALRAIGSVREAYFERLELEKPEGCARGNLVASSTRQAIAGLSGIVREGVCDREVGVWVADIESYFNKVDKRHVRGGVEALVEEGVEHVSKEENKRNLIERMSVGKEWKDGKKEKLLKGGGVVVRSFFDRGRCRVTHKLCVSEKFGKASERFMRTEGFNFDGGRGYRDHDAKMWGELIVFLSGHSYVSIGGRVFFQMRGIAQGSHSSTFLADQSLRYKEVMMMRKLWSEGREKEAWMFSMTMRYVDDVGSMYSVYQDMFKEMTEGTLNLKVRYFRVCVRRFVCAAGSMRDTEFCGRIQMRMTRRRV